MGKFLSSAARIFSSTSFWGVVVAIIDDREVDAIKLWKKIEAVRKSSVSSSVDVSRLALYLQFLNIVARPDFWAEKDYSALLGLADSVSNKLVGGGDVPRAIGDLVGKVNRELGVTESFDPVNMDVSKNIFLNLRGLFENSNVDVPLSVEVYRFNYVFHQLCRAALNLDIKKNEFVSAFCENIAVNQSSVLDVHSLFGDLAVRLGERVPELRYLVSSTYGTLQSELGLRLIVNGIRASRLRWEADISSSSLASFNIFSSSVRRASPSLEHSGQQGKVRVNSHPLEIALDFSRYSALNQIAVLILPSADLKVKNGWRAEVRGMILRQISLLAVVEIPRSALTGGGRWSLILLRREFGASSQKTIFVQGGALDGLSGQTPEQLGRFCGLPVSELVNAKALMQPISTSVSTLGSFLGPRADRMFGKGYRDVDGFCRAVDYDEFNSDSRSLSPSDFIESSPHSDFKSLLDDSPVRDLLDRGEGGNRIYIIGNNGQGKSFLLRELVSVFAGKSKTVYAVAFGATDRFSLKIGSGDVPVGYHYLGSRTGSAGVNPRKIAHHAAQLMARIYSSPVHLEVFNDVAQRMGFSSDHFLLPAVKGADFLENVVKFDFDLVNSFDGSKGQRLGIKRGGNEIVPFDELSSGEQQLMLLFAKIIAHAGPETLFLIDEPETSLHVSWQQGLPQVFALVASKFSMDIVIATHSPVVIASATGLDDHCFLAQDGELKEISKASSRSVETALFEGFRLYTKNNREVHERCAEIIAQAISIANDASAKKDFSPLLEEMVDMRDVVLHSVKGDRETHAARDLELIERASSALTEISEMFTGLPARGENV